jgi:hypothetical protein
VANKKRKFKQKAWLKPQRALDDEEAETMPPTLDSSNSSTATEFGGDSSRLALDFYVSAIRNIARPT